MLFRSVSQSRYLDEEELSSEVIDSKRILQERLGIPINYFTYPEGKLDERVRARVIAAGYQMAFSMDDADEKFEFSITAKDPKELVPAHGNSIQARPP